MFWECCWKRARSGKVFGILQSKECFGSAVGNGQVVGKSLVLYKTRSVLGVLSEMGRLWEILWYYTKLRPFWECCWKSEGSGKVFGITQSKECFGSAVVMNLCFDLSGSCYCKGVQVISAMCVFTFVSMQS